jgi:hypothetical protein
MAGGSVEGTRKRRLGYKAIVVNGKWVVRCDRGRVIRLCQPTAVTEADWSEYGDGHGISRRIIRENPYIASKQR